MLISRASGILCHISSLSGKYGIGDFGSEAYKFIDFLTETQQKFWQILPISDTTNNSPYSCISAFAGNYLFISPDLLLKDKYITKKDLENFPENNRVDFNSVKNFKTKLLKKAFEKFQQSAKSKQEKFLKFCNNNKFWLEDYSLYKTLKDHFEGLPWFEWEENIKCRNKKSLAEYEKQLKSEIEYYKFIQYIFFEQLNTLKQYANKSGIEIIGDIPFYLDYDSCDIWSSSELFQLDKNKKPIAVSGTPADQFSDKGQLWGMPVYDWNELKKTDYQWWLNRLKHSNNIFNYTRIDHFRALEAYWSIPYGESNPEKGKWIKAFGDEFLNIAYKQIKNLNIIAEDLGLITPEVIALRDKFQIAGMKILQFAFLDNNKNTHLPHNYDKNFIAYTATHDNNTTIGWFNNLKKTEQKKVLDYLGASNKNNINWQMIKLISSSVANTAIIPIQDILGLGEESRMNNPIAPENNWTWRFTNKMLTPKIKKQLQDNTVLYGRYFKN